jgi:hypothetical protein
MPCIVNAVKLTSKNWYNFGHLIDGIKDGLRSWRVKHLQRDANSAAHSLAKEAILDVIDRVWVKETSSCIYGIANREQFVPI